MKHIILSIVLFVAGALYANAQTITEYNQRLSQTSRLPMMSIGTQQHNLHLRIFPIRQLLMLRSSYIIVDIVVVIFFSPPQHVRHQRQSIQERMAN